MSAVPIPKILLIENDAAAAEAIRTALDGAEGGAFELQWSRQLSEGLDCVAKKGIAAILLGMSLPESHGIEAFEKLFGAAPDVPILILGGNVSETLAKEAV